MIHLNKNFIKQSLIYFASFLLIAFVLFAYNFQINQNMVLFTKNNIIEVAQQQIYSFQNKIDSEKTMLKTLANSIGDDFYNKPRLKALLINLVSDSKFEYLGISDLHGETIINTGMNVNIRDRDYFKSVVLGETIISGPLKSKINNESVIVIATPIKVNKKVVGILAATYNEKYLSQVFEHVYSGTSNTYLVTNEGEIFAQTSNANYFTEGLNIFDIWANADFTYGDSYNKVKQNFYYKRSGFFEFTFDGSSRQVYYRPVDINNWTLIISVPSQSTSGIKNIVVITTYIITSFIILIFAVLIYSLYSKSKRHQKELMDKAFVDEITGGNTKAKFKLLAKEFIENNTNKNIYICAIDINNFRAINDIYGFDGGNNVLTLVNKALHSILNEGEFCARSTNDKFYFLSTYKTGDVDIVTQGAKFRERFNELLSKQTYSAKVTFTTGAYKLSKNETNIDEILERVNLALRKAKEQNSQRVIMFDDQIRGEKIIQLQLEADMKKGLLNNEFKVYLQPKIDIKTNQLAGAEALVRWKKEDGQTLMPNQFIPIFEKKGLIIDLDLYILEQVCMLQNKWINRGFPVVPISVNQSKLLLETENYANKINSIADKHKVPHELICVEITETILFDNLYSLNKLIATLKKSNFTVAIDDFGKGYSSLSMLKNIDVDSIKIDKSFLVGIEEERSQVILFEIIHLIKSLNTHVLLEGIETEDQLELVKARDCDYAQGYLFDRPLSVSNFEKKYIIPNE